MATAIVANKISNQLCVISRHRWEGCPEWKKDAEQIRKLQEKISTAETTNELLGIEGMCSNIYFRTFGVCSAVILNFTAGTDVRPGIRLM